MKTVLLVTDRRSTEVEVGGALEAEGIDVIVCPGPQPPSYICMAWRCQGCALADVADAVVLDCGLASDTTQQGITSWQLARFYRSLALPVVALADPEDLQDTWNGSITILPHTCDASAVVAAVADVVARRRESSGSPGSAG